MDTKKRYGLYLSVFSFLFSGAVATGYFLENVDPIAEWRGSDYVLWASLVLLLFFIVRFFLNALITGSGAFMARSCPTAEFDLKKYGIIAFLSIMAGYVIVWLTYYPGLWNYDPWQVKQVMTGSYDCWHPLIHTLLLGGCYVLGSALRSPNLGLAIYDWIQMLFLAAVFAYTCALILKQTRRRRLFWAAVVFYALFPVNSVLAISTTKDVIFAGLVLLSLIVLRRYLYDGPSKGILIALFVSVTFMLLFRNNASYAYGLFLVFAIGSAVKKAITRKDLLFLILPLFICLGVGNLLASTLKAKPVDPGEAASIPSVQMGRIYYSGTADKEDKALIEKFIDIKKASYRPNLADSLKFHLKNKDLKEILAASVKLFFKHPATSADAFLYLHKGAWYLTDTSHAEVYKHIDMGYLQTYSTDKNAGVYGIVNHSKLPMLERVYERLFRKNEYLKNPVAAAILSPAFYNWILLGCMFVFLFRKMYKEFLLSCFPACLIATVLLGPCSLIRYYYPVVVSVPLLIAWALAGPPSRRGAVPGRVS